MNSNPERAAISVDAFHRGQFVVVQPKDGGHRSGIDAMLLAATVPTSLSGRVADLGAGAGAAGLAVASRCASAHVTLVEKDPFMINCAMATVNHESNQAFASRLSVLESDVSANGKARVASGLEDTSFDCLIMNPPFNLARDRQTPDARKAGAHVMPEGLFDAWLRTAAAILKSGGGVAMIARPQSLHGVLNACGNRFGGLRIVPVLPRPGAAAIRILVAGTKGSKAGLSIEPSLVLHGETGNELLPFADELCNGRCGLFEQTE